MATWAIFMKPATFTVTVSTSSATFRSRLLWPAPALMMTRSAPPSASRTSSKMAAASSCVTSIRRTTVSGENVWRSASSRSSLRANSPRRQPSRFNCRASASPMPDEAPMMTAVRLECVSMCSRNRPVTYRWRGYSPSRVAAARREPPESAVRPGANPVSGRRRGHRVRHHIGRRRLGGHGRGRSGGAGVREALVWPFGVRANTRHP